MTPQQVKDLINSIWTRAGADRVSDADLRDGGIAIIDLMASIASSVFPDWTALLTFNTNGSGAGAYCKLADTAGRIRFWITLTDGNINHSPPTNPVITSNAYWQEGSPSGSSAIQEWAAGLYAAGLVVVYYDLAPGGIPDPGLYLLTEAARPYSSLNFATELEAGSWRRIGGSGGFVGNTMDSEFTDVRNVDVTESTLSDLTIAANKFFADGQWIKSEITIQISNTAATKQIRGYIGSTMIFDSGVIAGGSASFLILELFMIRRSDSLVRITCKLSGAAGNPQYSETAFVSAAENHLKVTAQAGVGGIDGDITVRSSYHLWYNHATLDVFGDEFGDEFE